MTFFMGGSCLYFLAGLQRFVNVCRSMLVVLLAALHLACAATPLPSDGFIKPDHEFSVCTRDPDIEPFAMRWAYSRLEAPAVSNLHPYEFNRAVLSSGIAYRYDPFAPNHSPHLMPIRHSKLPCDRIHKIALELTSLRPCSDDLCALSMPNEFKLPNDRGVCRLDTTPVHVGREKGNVLGQTEPVIRSRYFCETDPVVPKNGTERILDREGEIAWLEGFFYGHRVSLLLTQAEADAQAFIDKSDPWIVKLFKKDPESVDAILQRVASALDAIPEPPQYDREYTAMLAADGYAVGSRRGAAEVEATLVLIEATATIAEVALMEVALGPLGGATVLRAAVSRLGQIRVFVPAAAKGAGAFVRLGKVAETARKVWSSKRLAKALIKAGKVRRDGHDAHHIVAHGHDAAEPARKVLAKFKIDLDEAVNGVFLPATESSLNPLGSTVHRPLSNMKAYYEKVNEALKDLTTKKEVIAKLQEIAQQLTNGTFL